MMTMKFSFKEHLKQLGVSVVSGLLACSVYGQVTVTSPERPQVVSGEDFSIVLDAGGNLYSFGSNSAGQLGVAEIGGFSADPLLIESDTPWVHIAVSPSNGGDPKSSSNRHALGVKEDGTVWAWGSNERGQLGNGTTTDSEIPVQVIGLPAECVRVAAGGQFSFALTSDGELWAWGDNTHGQLGQEIDYPDENNGVGDAENGHNIVAIPARVGSDFYRSVATGIVNIIAVRDDGAGDRALVSWGYSVWHQLGLGFTPNSPFSEPQLVDEADDWTEVFSGTNICFAFKEGESGGIPYDGKLYVWGNGLAGQDGFPRGTRTQKVPVALPSSKNDWASIAIGYDHVLGVDDSGALWGWGDNYRWQLGDSLDQSTFYSPVQIESGTTVEAASAGLYFSVIVTDEEVVRTSGLNTVGQLGNGEISSAQNPQDGFGNSGIGIPDLIISSVIVTSFDEDSLESSLLATATVRNTGTGTITDDIEFAAVLSLTPNFDAAAYTLEVSSGTITDDLSPGQSRAASLVIDFPTDGGAPAEPLPINAGEYYLMIRVDPNNNIVETDDTNNDGYDLTDGDDVDEEPDTLLFAADLRVETSDIVIDPPEGDLDYPLEPNDVIRVTTTIHNDGIGTIPAGTAGAFATRHVLARVASINDSSVINLVELADDPSTGDVNEAQVLVDDPLTPDVDESYIIIEDGVNAKGSIVTDFYFVLPESLGIGDFFAGVSVDEDGDITESDETNNVAFTATNFIQVTGLDLSFVLNDVLVSGSAPSNPNPGDPVNDDADPDFTTDGDAAWYGTLIADRVNGNAAVSPAIGVGQIAQIKIELDEVSRVTFDWKSDTSSSDNKLTFGFFGASAEQRAEISGVTDWQTVSIIVPAGTTLIWQYTEDADAADDEVFLDNIIIEEGVTLPDFAVDTVELTSEQQPIDSGSYVLRRDRLGVNIVLANFGADHNPADSATFDYAIYLSPDSSFDPNADYLIESIEFTQNFDNGPLSLGIGSYELPETIPGGDYYLMVVVDEDNRVPESGEPVDPADATGANVQANNLFVSELAVVTIQALSDLTVTNIQPNPGPKGDPTTDIANVGDDLDFALTLENLGLEAINFGTDIKVRIIFSDDANLDDSDYIFGEFNYDGGLAEAGEAGDSRLYEPNQATVPNNIPIGEFLFFGVVIDPDNEFEEINEDNNVKFYQNPYFMFEEVSLEEAAELSGDAIRTETVAFEGDRPWIGQKSTFFNVEGNDDAAMSSVVGDGGIASFETVITPETDTVISFRWKVSSERVIVDGLLKADWLRVYVNDTLVGQIAGEQDWQEFRYAVDGGQTYTVRWSYEKDDDGEAGQDRGWVDQFVSTAPDLQVSDISITSDLSLGLSPGNDLEFDVTVINDSADAVPATPTYTLHARLSQDNQWGGSDDVELIIDPAVESSGELAANGTAVYSISVPIPPNFAEPGEYYLAVRVDPDPATNDDPVNGPGAIAESNDNNNTTFSDAGDLITIEPDISLVEALELDSVSPVPVLSTGGDASWYGIQNPALGSLPPGTSGAGLNDIASAGGVGALQESYFETLLEGPQIVKFRWKVDSAPAANYLEVSVNGVLEERISGRVDWDFGYGPFTISYDGETTAQIRAHASALEVQEALNDLTTITSSGGVVVTAPDDFSYEITFVVSGNQTGNMTFNALEPLRIGNSSLSTTTQGADSIQEVRLLSIDPNVGFTLSYQGESTDQIPYYATPAEVETALDALSTIVAAGGVSVALHTNAETSPEAGESVLDFVISFDVVGERELIEVNPAGLRQPVTIEAELYSDRFRGTQEGQLGTDSDVQIQPLRIGPEITIFIPAGPGAQLVRWSYRKTASAGDYLDTAYIDQVELIEFTDATPELTAELVLTDLDYVAGTYVLDVGAINGAPDQKLGTETLDITVQAQNQGRDLDPTVDVFTSADLEVRLSTDRIYGNVDDIVLGSFTQVEGSFESGQFMSFLGGLPLGDHIPENDYYLIVKIDANDRVDEFSSSNNIVITDNPDVRVERKPRLLIYDGLNDPNVFGNEEAFYVDVVEYDEAKLYYPEAPMRLEMEIQNVGLDDLFDADGRLLSWRVNYQLGFVDREELSNALSAGGGIDEFENAITGYLDLGSTTIAEAMEGRRLSAPDGDRVILDIEFTLPTGGRMVQIFAEDKGITDYTYFIQITVDADDTVDESGEVNVWKNVDLIDVDNTTFPIADVDDGLFSMFASAPTNAAAWGNVYGVVADADSADPEEVDNFLAYAFNRNPASGVTTGGQFPGTYGVDTLESEDYLTVTFDLVTRSNDLAYIVEASNGVDFTAGNLISALTIAPPFDSLVGSNSLTGEGGLIDQVGAAGDGQENPEDLIHVVAVVDEGSSARVTLRYPTTVADTLNGFMRVVVESRVPSMFASDVVTFVSNALSEIPDSDPAPLNPELSPEGDYDADGINNLIELMYGTNPKDDTETPTLSDPEDSFVAEQFAVLGIYEVDMLDIAAADDYDGDGSSNLAEVIVGTDPDNFSDQPNALQVFVADAFDTAGVLTTQNTQPDSDYDQDGVSNIREIYSGTDLTVADGVSPAVDAHVIVQMAVLGVVAGPVGARDDFDLDGVNNLTEIQFGSNPIDNSSVTGASEADIFVAEEMAELGVLGSVTADPIFTPAVDVGSTDDNDLDTENNLIELLLGTDPTNGASTPVVLAVDRIIAEEMALRGALGVGIDNIAYDDDYDLDGVSNLDEWIAGTDPTDPTE